jgi:hypothetical protein
MTLRDDQVRVLLIACQQTQEEEIDCDQFLVGVPQYAEGVAGDAPRGVDFAKVEAHERLCAHCRGELAALVDCILAHDPR